jgi:hypothetical protein
MEEHQDQDRRLYDENVAILKERVNNWMESTTEYRRALCAKIDLVISKQNDLSSRIDKLPCDSRKPMWDMVIRNVYALWAFVGVITITIIVEWIKRQ